ncbi:hypothetical protein [Streptomyces sp. SCL15-6]|jgi:hypothetical protein|uniref:hypothetical protein n=1 Tax=Streptomyces sp. SCL15-6 TaxID=2967222 RepID=UPI0029675D8E|nr:hypothetical protein [Streptomyces sp. SCL15-6]
MLTCSFELSVATCVLIGAVVGMGASVVAAALGASPIDAVKAGSAAFIGVAGLALVVEARVNSS